MNNKQAYNSKGALLSRACAVVAMLLVSVAAFAQQTIKGNVKDNTGEPVVGATVVEVGATTGAITDFDGNYTITVSANAKSLEFAFIGYETITMPITGPIVNAVLNEESFEMEQIVVVGYGQQKKESVVGAISQVSSKELLSSPAANVSQAIVGKIPGVITSQTSGAPGSDDTKIFIRGRATFSGEDQPLVLVDGVERSFSQIAPDDIETISVLKDASATAVYGVRGANGVMLITTKRGRSAKPEVNLSANFQWQAPTREDTYLNSYESVKLLEEALANDGLQSQYSAADIEMYRKSCAGELSEQEALYYPNVDWYKEVLNSWAPAQRYNASVRGDTKRMRYYVSGEFYNQNGIIKNLSLDKYNNISAPRYRRYAFRANLDFEMASFMSLAVNFGTRFEQRKGSNTDEKTTYSEIFNELNRTPGWLFPVSYNVEGKTLYGGSAQYQNNIVANLATHGYYTSTHTINETNFVLNFDLSALTQGLSAKMMYSFDYDSYDKRKYNRSFATYELNDRVNTNVMDSYTRFNTDGELGSSKEANTTMKLYLEGQINYARTFGDVHDVTAMVLYNQNDLRYQSDLNKRYQGIVGRATYGYDSRYLAEINFGFNGSENFMKGKRFGFFPAFSLGWILTNESFMEDYKEVLNNLKIRASYGEVGNDKYKGERFLYQEKWVQKGNDYTFGTTGQTGIFESQYPNYDVTWERAKKFNLGVEASLYDGLIGAVIDIFKENRSGILTPYLSRPEWVGVSMASDNLGKTTNKGFEIELKHNNRIGEDFNYNVGFTFAHAENEIVCNDEPALKTSYRKLEGKPISQYFGLQCDGFITEADIQSGKLAKSTFAKADLKPGDLKYRDQNGDGFIDERDEVAIGNSDIPENTFSLTLGGTYKGLGFSCMFQGVTKVSRYYDATAQFAFVGGGKVKEHHLDRWNPALSEAQNLANAKYPLLHYDAYGEHNQRANSFFLKNGQFLRLKNVEVSYSLPKNIVSKAGMSDCRIYVNGNNLITWDKLDKLVDPESNGSNRYPIMKTVNVGLNVKF